MIIYLDGSSPHWKGRDGDALVASYRRCWRWASDAFHQHRQRRSLPSRPFQCRHCHQGRWRPRGSWLTPKKYAEPAADAEDSAPAGSPSTRILCLICGSAVHLDWCSEPMTVMYTTGTSRFFVFFFTDNATKPPVTSVLINTVTIIY